MATLEQEDNLRQRLRDVLKSIVDIDGDDLLREDLGPLNLKKGKPVFERSLRLFRELSTVNFDAIPHNRLSQLLSTAETASQRFYHIIGFSVENVQSPSQHRDQMIFNIRDSYEEQFNLITPIVAYSAKERMDFTALEEEARLAVEKLNDVIKEQENARTNMMNEIETILNKVKKAAREVGLTEYARHFKLEADEHKDSAAKWLKGTIMLSLVTVIFGIISYISFMKIIPTLTLSQNIQLTVSKVIIFSILLTATIWCGKIYRAHRHNNIVNRHRENALSTFEAFVKATDDEQTKNAVLLQATQCIFSAQHSGYITHEPETGGYPQILEIVRGITSPQSKP